MDWGSVTSAAAVTGPSQLRPSRCPERPGRRSPLRPLRASRQRRSCGASRSVADPAASCGPPLVGPLRSRPTFRPTEAVGERVEDERAPATVLGANVVDTGDPSADAIANVPTWQERSAGSIPARRICIAPSMRGIGSGRGRDTARGNRLTRDVLTGHLLDDHGGGAPGAVFPGLGRCRADRHERGRQQAGDGKSLHGHESKVPSPASCFNRSNGLSLGSSRPMTCVARRTRRLGQPDSSVKIGATREIARPRCWAARMCQRHPERPAPAKSAAGVNGWSSS